MQDFETIKAPYFYLFKEVKYMFPMSFERKNDKFVFHFVEKIDDSYVLSKFEYFDFNESNMTRDLFRFSGTLISCYPFSYNNSEAMLYSKIDENGHEGIYFTAKNVNGNFRNISAIEVRRVSSMFEMLDKNYYRDPFVMPYNGGYYIYISSKRNGTPLLLQYFTQDFKKFKLRQKIYSKKSIGGELRYSNVVKFNDDQAFLTFTNVHDTKVKAYGVLHNFKKPMIELSKNNLIEVDQSDDVYFYKISYKLGKLYAIACMSANGKNGISMIREVTFENGKIVQKPYRSLLDFKNPVIQKTLEITKPVAVLFKEENFSYTLEFKLGEENTVLVALSTPKELFKVICNTKSKQICFKKDDTELKTIQLDKKLENLKLEIYKNGDVIEFYMDKGRVTYSTIFVSDKLEKITFYVDKPTHIITYKQN